MTYGKTREEPNQMKDRIHVEASQKRKEAERKRRSLIKTDG